MSKKKSLINPQSDTLAASFLGKRNPERKDRDPADGPPVHYTELDENWYRIQDIYGEQEERKPRYRNGGRVDG